jgi:hypothetical protein
LDVLTGSFWSQENIRRGRRGRQGVVKLKMLRVAKRLRVNPEVIKAVRKELLGGTNTPIEHVLRIEGRGRVFLFVLSEEFRDLDLPLNDLKAENWTGECPSRFQA